MSIRYKAKRRARYRRNGRRCEDCGKPYSIECRYAYGCGGRDDGKADEHLCGECAAKAGFCRVCGDFCGGTSGFDFAHPGLCDNCHDQMRADFDDSEPDGEDCFNEAFDEVPW